FSGSYFQSTGEFRKLTCANVAGSPPVTVGLKAQPENCGRFSNPNLAAWVCSASVFVNIVCSISWQPTDSFGTRYNIGGPDPNSAEMMRSAKSELLSRCLTPALDPEVTRIASKIAGSS